MLRTPRSFTARAATLLAAGVILLGACGSDDSSSDTTPTLPLEPVASTTVAPGGSTVAPTPTAPPPSTTPGKPTVSSLPTLPVATLGINDLTEGTGPAAKEGDSLIVDYVGVRSADGMEFDNSYDRGSPLVVTPLGQASVIEGWNVGLVGMKEGGTRQLDIPTAMAYDDSPPGEPLQPGDDLTFIVVLRQLVPAADPAAEPTVTVAPTSGTTKTTNTDLVEGTGAEAVTGKSVMVQYIAYSGADGAKLESSWSAGGAPLSFQIGAQEFLAGFDLGAEGMKVGGRRQVVIPPAEGFGPDGSEQLGLPAGADLVMVFDLLAVF